MIAHGLVSHRARRSLSYEPGFFLPLVMTVSTEC